MFEECGVDGLHGTESGAGTLLEYFSWYFLEFSWWSVMKFLMRLTATVHPVTSNSPKTYCDSQDTFGTLCGHRFPENPSLGHNFQKRHSKQVKQITRRENMSSNESEYESGGVRCEACDCAEPHWKCQGDDCYNTACDTCTTKVWCVDHERFLYLCDTCTLEDWYGHMRIAQSKEHAEEIHRRMKAAFDVQTLLRQQVDNPPRLHDCAFQIEEAMDEEGKLYTNKPHSKNFHELEEKKTVRVRVAGGYLPIEVTTTYRVKNYDYEIERLAKRRRRRKTQAAFRRHGGVFRRTRSRARRGRFLNQYP